MPCGRQTLRGFGSVEAYFEDVVREDLAALKTPPFVLDKIDAGLADLNAGNIATLPAVETFLARRRADWIDERAG